MTLQETNTAKSGVFAANLRAWGKHTHRLSKNASTICFLMGLLARAGMLFRFSLLQGDKTKQNIRENQHNVISLKAIYNKPCELWPCAGSCYVKHLLPSCSACVCVCVGGLVIYAPVSICQGMNVCVCVQQVSTMHPWYISQSVCVGFRSPRACLHMSTVYTHARNTHKSEQQPRAGAPALHLQLKPSE